MRYLGLCKQKLHDMERKENGKKKKHTHHCEFSLSGNLYSPFINMNYYCSTLSLLLRDQGKQQWVDRGNEEH